MTAAEAEDYGVANMTADKCVEFQFRLSSATNEATTSSLTDTDRVVKHLESKCYGITSNDRMQFKREFSIRSIEFDTRWKAIGIQELRKIIEQHVIHFRYRKMHLLSHISQWIWPMGSGNNFTTNMSEPLHIGNVKEAYRSTNKVNYIIQMLKHNDWCTSLDYMEETPFHLALHGWYNSDCA